MIQNKLKMILQYLAPQHALSWLGGVLCECRWRWWKNWQINLLIKYYGADLKAASLEHIDDYPTFNSFFTRALKPELRPVIQGDRQIACPVDGSISQIGRIQNNLLFQAKGFYFNLTTLLGGSETAEKEFASGHFATLYLAPKDYHRVHMPFSGQLRETIYVPGKLFSVNPLTTDYIPQLFARNERLVCLFDTSAGPMAVILVGAMLVSSIQVIWSQEKIYAKTIRKTVYSDLIEIERGAELGRFKMGSTVILLFAKDKMEWSNLLQPTATVKMGQLMGTLNT
ncbi:MAG: psd [Gammaproteobacteria bacterium]|jgi:phosphatidylserine decarboxylase|nr:psd [Gammaproteobacteria bacterium]